MDAQVAYGFHHLRNEKPYLAQGPISNKVCFNTFSFFTMSFHFLFYLAENYDQVDWCSFLLKGLNFIEISSL